MPPSGISVLQCGDPTGTGGGGPGLLVRRRAQRQGDVPGPARWRWQNAGPNTNGSQFFIVYGPTQLSPGYTVFGTIDAAGIKLVEEAAAEGTNEGGLDGTPKVPVDITSVS